MFKNQAVTAKGDLHSIEDFDRLIHAAKSGAFELIVVVDPNPSVTVKVKPDKLTDADIPSIQALFHYFFEEKQDVDLALVLGKHKVAIGDFEGSLKITKNELHKDVAKVNSETLLNVFSFSYPLFSAHRIAVGLLSALSQSNISVDIIKLSERLSNELEVTVNNINPKNEFVDMVINEFVGGFLYLCERGGGKKNNETVISISLPNLVRLLTVTDKFSAFPQLSKEPCITALRNLDEKHSFLHYALKNGKPDSFKFLAKIMYQDADLPIPEYDTDGNGFLHVAKDSKTLQVAYEFSSDVNHQNKLGNTALMETASTSDLNKAVFLLQHGANQHIQDGYKKTFWSQGVGNEQDSLTAYRTSLTFYRRFKTYGNVLKLPIELIKQRSVNCGFYAVAYSVAHHRAEKPDSFKGEAIPARKSDTKPRSMHSLRQMRHELEIPGHGWIFSATHIQKLIEKAGCTSMVCDIENFDQFFSLIKIAIANNLPIIIPYSSKGEGRPLTDGKSETAHWATIIGWAEKENEKGVLIASNGQYISASAEDFFNSFYNMDAIFKKSILFKKKGEGVVWDFVNKETTEELPSDARSFVIPDTDLTDFRRKLVVVLPPDCEPEILNSLKQITSKESSVNTMKKLF